MILREKRTVWIENFEKADPRDRLLSAMKAGLRSGFTFPVIVQGQVAAFLEFVAEEPRPPDRLLLEAIGSVGAQLARLIERGRAEAVRAQLAAIVESSQDAIVSTAPDRTILTWNTGAERLFGYAASEAIGRDLSFLVPDNLRHEIGHSSLAPFAHAREDLGEDQAMGGNGGRRGTCALSPYGKIARLYF